MSTRTAYRHRQTVRLATLAGLTAAVLGTALAGGAGAAVASEPNPAAWVGAPAASTWPNTDGCDGSTDTAYCSTPDAHHVVYTNPDNGIIDDLAMDIQGVGPGTAVQLFAGAVDAGVALEARVQYIAPACSSGVLADGGSVVGVGLYANGVATGSVTYAHLDPSVSVGQTVDLAGGQIGTVGAYTAGSCWTGAHIHLELSSQTNYACYTGYTPGQALTAGTQLGYVGGSYATGQRAACP